MNKFLIILCIGTVFCFNLFSQSTDIRELEAEVKQLENCNEFFSKYQKSVTNHKYERNKAIIELNPNALFANGFAKFCQDYHNGIVIFERNLDNYTNITNNHIIYSINKKNNKAEINVYYETVPIIEAHSKRPQVDIVEPVSKRPQVDPNLTELKRITDAIKWYQDLSNTLQHQMKYNLVETVDNAGDLLLKHVSIPIGDELEAKVMDEIRKNAGVEKEKPIKNSVADIVNLVVDDSEKIIELVPGGDVITNHYLWKLFKSTPEAGKGLGHIAASVNIYFRKSEYDSKITELKTVQQQLLQTINKK